MGCISYNINMVYISNDRKKNRLLRAKWWCDYHIFMDWLDQAYQIDYTYHEGRQSLKASFHGMLFRASSMDRIAHDNEWVCLAQGLWPGKISRLMTALTTRGTSSEKTGSQRLSNDERLSFQKMIEQCTSHLIEGTHCYNRDDMENVFVWRDDDLMVEGPLIEAAEPAVG